jgi:hypothetical protein
MMSGKIDDVHWAPGFRLYCTCSKRDILSKTLPEDLPKESPRRLHALKLNRPLPIGQCAPSTDSAFDLVGGLAVLRFPLKEASPATSSRAFPAA